MKKLLRPGVIVAAMCLGVSGTARADDEGKACGPRTLHGRYVFAASGFTIVAVNGVEQSQPKAIIEIIDFHGDETLSVVGATRSVNGAVATSPPSVGTYTVNAECTGSIMFAAPPFPTFDIAVEPRGDGLWMIQTNQGSVFQGTATRVWQHAR
jgi:hypothetical protein